MIQFKNASAGYRLSNGDFLEVLLALNITINPGEYVAIMGGNGSGKSTFARLCNGLKLPEKGEVFVDGFEVNDQYREKLFEVRKRVGIIFQNPDNQIISATVEREIAFGLENIGLETAEIERRVYKALEDFDLTDVRKHPPDQLSGGEKQRLAIASVIAMKPNYVIFDEPTAYLDSQNRKNLLRAMSLLNGRGEKKAIIHITHRPVEALFAERLIILKDSRIWMDDKPQHIFQKADELAAAGFLPPVEFQIFHALKPSIRDNVGIDQLLLDPIL